MNKLAHRVEASPGASLVRCLGLQKPARVLPKEVSHVCRERKELAVRTQIPESYLDLVNGPRVAALTTVMPDGQPQTTAVWCNFDGTHVLVNTMRGFRKEKNMRLNPKVTLLCYDPRQPLRFIEVRGTVVEMTEEGALEHLDSLSELYTGMSPYFGACVPAEFKEKEKPVLCKILPTHVVTLDARRKEVVQL